MPWESKTVEKLREEFIEAAKVSTNLSALCREFGISRPTAYKWLEREQRGETLSNKSKAPLTQPGKTSPETEKLILKVRKENPGWGGKTIHKVLENEGHINLLCAKTINNILKRNNCISKEESLKHTPYIRYEKEYCNEMWQTDFKGEFKLPDGNLNSPLTILDDRSRYSIAIKPVLRTANVVISAFKQAFYEYGVPKSVLSDNGGQFAGFRQGYTHFEKFLMNHDILPIHGRVKHPQTQGKTERFHRSMKYELLKHNTFKDINEADSALQNRRIKYNEIRPHEALGMRCPAEVYRRSEREYNDVVKKYEYGGQFHVIKVNSWGYVRFDKWQEYLSETMIGEFVEFRPNPIGDSFFACYRNFSIAEFSAIDGKLLRRHIKRL